jgi:hypothetical protein
LTTSKATFTPDVFAVGGEVFLPPPKRAPVPLAAISFVERVAADLRDARRIALRRALAVATAGIPATDCLGRLLVSYAWEPDGVRARTSSPLKGLAAKGIAFPPSSDRREVLVLASQGVRWSADVAVRSEDASQIEATLFQSSGALLIVGARESIIHRFLSEGWGESVSGRSFLSDAAVLGAQLGLVVVRLFGAFDDREVSADLIGRPEQLLALQSRDP